MLIRMSHRACRLFIGTSLNWSLCLFLINRKCGGDLSR